MERANSEDSGSPCGGKDERERELWHTLHLPTQVPFPRSPQQHCTTRVPLLSEHSQYLDSENLPAKMLDFVLMLTDFVMQVLRLTKQDVIAFAGMEDFLVR